MNKEFCSRYETKKDGCMVAEGVPFVNKWDCNVQYMWRHDVCLFHLQKTPKNFLWIIASKHNSRSEEASSANAYKKPGSYLPFSVSKYSTCPHRDKDRTDRNKVEERNNLSEKLSIKPILIKQPHNGIKHPKIANIHALTRERAGLGSIQAIDFAFLHVNVSLNIRVWEGRKGRGGAFWGYGQHYIPVRG